MNVQHPVYDDGVIADALVALPHSPKVTTLAIRWLKPQHSTTRNGTSVEATNLMGGETDWFIVPSTLGAAIGRTLVEQRTAGLPGFDPGGFAALVQWLVDDDELHDAMCY